MISLQQLRALVLTVRYKKLTLAAERMGVRQPTITFHLAKLEEAMGLPIFLSSGRQSWRLTDFGQSLYEYAVRMTSLEDEIQVLAEDTKQWRRGRIRMGSTHTPATYLFPRVLSSFRSQYPGINISLDVAPSHLLLPKVLNYELDFCCINHYPSSDAALAAVPVIEDQFVLIAHPDRLAERLSLTPEDIAQDFIMHEPGSMTRQIIDVWFQEQRVQPRVLMDVSGTETMKQLVKQNVGVAIVSALSCIQECREGALTAHRLPDFGARRTIYLVRRHDVQLSPAAEAFLQLLVRAGQDLHLALP